MATMHCRHYYYCYGENRRFARRHPDPLAGAVILQSRRAEKSWIFGFMFWLGISKTLAGPMDLHMFVVLDERRFLGFLCVGARIHWQGQ